MPMPIARIRRDLIARRWRLQLHQSEVARRMGTGQPAMHQLENGGDKDIYLSTLERWAKALNLRVRIVLEEASPWKEGK